MIRKVSLAVALAVGSLPFSAFGLGLGEIRAYSALNQEFKADIELYSVPQGELDGVKVALAKSAAFLRAGVERPYYLTHLRFETIRQRDGSAVIRVTSREPIREPFLDFLIEVNWPKGSLVKEYTVLLDPPTTTSRRPQAISQPVSRVAASGTTRPSARAVTRARIEPGTQQYGPVLANETMWVIADALRPEGVTVHQMMMALQEANPSAFIDNNINLLKQGQILRIPSQSEILAQDSRQAKASFVAQTQEWLAGTTGRGTNEAVETREPYSGVGSATGTAREPGATLRIASAGPGDAVAIGDGSPDRDDIARQLIAARENEETARQQAGMLEQEVTELRDQVEDLQRLLALKDEQLAQLQANIASQEIVAEDVMATVADTADDPASMGGEMLTEENVAMVEDDILTSPEQSMPVAGEMVDAEPVQETIEAPVMADVTEPVAAVAETPEETAPQEPEPMAAVTEEKERDWLDRNLPSVLGFGTIGLIGISALFAFMRRNKYSDEQWVQTKREMEESMLLEETQDLESVLSEIVDVDDVAMSNDTSFLSEYSTDDLNALQEDSTEADPLAEADVYVAYGRYQQAEELLQSALREQPDRLPLKHKMLEIYFATQNKDAFFKLAGSMIDAGQDKEDLPAWEQVTVMGHDLDPSNPLFARGSLGMEETVNLSQLAGELDSKLQDDDTESTASMGLDSIDFGGSRLGLDSQDADDLVELGKTGRVGGKDTELHTEMQDASVLTEFTDTENIDDDFTDLEGDLDDMLGDTSVISEVDDAIRGLDEISEGIGDIGDSPDAHDFTEPTTEVEVDTKLELAQAYIDMGDEDGAREILAEIMQEGSEVQIAKAQKLQASLDA